MTIKEFFKSKEITETHINFLKCMVILQIILGLLCVAVELLY